MKGTLKSKTPSTRCFLISDGHRRTKFSGHRPAHAPPFPRDCSLMRGQGLADDCPMDKVQTWTVFGDMERLPSALEEVLSSYRKVRRVRWDDHGDKLFGETRRNVLARRQKVTLRIDERSPQNWAMTVCSETTQVWDYGRNAKSLEELGRALCGVGYQLESSGVATSWSRRTRP
jgi:hypothetical protein